RSHRLRLVRSPEIFPRASKNRDAGAGKKDAGQRGCRGPPVMTHEKTPFHPLGWAGGCAVMQRSGRARARRSHAVFLSEPVHAAAGVDELLLARKQRMADRADFHAQILLDRSGFKAVSAGAGHRRDVIFRMNSRFHGRSPLSALDSPRIQSLWTLNDYSTKEAPCQPAAVTQLKCYRTGFGSLKSKCYRRD